MSCLKKPLICSVLFCCLAGCGVKGDPLPPERPADLGRGRPTYKRAAEKIKIESARPDGTKRDDEDEDKDDE